MNNVEALDFSNFLPHRAPFLMVEKVLSIGNDHVATSYTIPKTSIFNDHGYFNEAGLVENAAQTCSSIVGKSYFKDDDLQGEGTKLIGFISAIKKVNIYACPKVETTITTKATLISRLDTEAYSLCTIACTTTQDDKELVSCELNLVIREIK